MEEILLQSLIGCLSTWMCVPVSKWFIASYIHGIYIYILDYMGHIWIMNHLLSWMHIQACLYLDPPFVQRKIGVIYR